MCDGVAFRKAVAQVADDELVELFIGVLAELAWIRDPSGCSRPRAQHLLRR